MSGRLTGFDTKGRRLLDVDAQAARQGRPGQQDNEAQGSRQKVQQKLYSRPFRSGYEGLNVEIEKRRRKEKQRV